jgi:hypothetical protein
VAVAITVTAVNDAPVNTVPAETQIAASNSQNIVFSSVNSNAISISDPDAGTGTLTVTLIASGSDVGKLTLGSILGLTSVTGNDTSNMTFQGTIADINNALNGLTYDPKSDNETDLITIVTSDGGNTGSGGAKTDSDSVTIDIGMVPPVVLDLDGDGLEFVAMGDASNQSQFDFNGDGAMETAAWVGSDDGFLVYDGNGDRRVNDGSEIAFADMTAEADTDIEALRVVFDSNHDNLLTAADERFSSFCVWQDANGNGVTEEGEFKTLDEIGIVSLGLVSDGRSYDAANGQVTVHGEANFTYQDGSQGLVGDVSLAIGGPAVSSEDSVGTADSVINPFDLVLSRQANNLRIAAHGSADQMTGQNWYSATSPQVETIQTGNGQTLLSSQVNQMVEAMAGFSSDNGMTWDQGLAAKPEEVQAVIAASWQ